MQSLQEQQAPIDRQIVEALIAATPETWNSAEMVVERQQAGSQEKMVIVISSPDGHKDLIGPTDDIYEALYKLSDVFLKAGKPWTKVEYWVGLDDQGQWKYRVQFSY